MLSICKTLTSSLSTAKTERNKVNSVIYILILYHHSNFQAFFITLEKSTLLFSPYPNFTSLPSTPLQVSTDLLPVCLTWTLTNEVMSYVVFCDHFLSFSMMSSRFSHGVARARTASLFWSSIHLCCLQISYLYCDHPLIDQGASRLL